MSKRKKVSSSYAISVIETFNLGGYKQKVLIEGKSIDLPIVICLHGGPGSPIPFSVGSRGLLPFLTDNYIMVYWDQLGCGINARIKNVNYTIDLFVKMTLDLVKEIKAKYPQNKIFFLSTSWGSLLSILSLKENPKLVDGVLAWGQIVKDCFINEHSLDALDKSKISRNKINQIRNIDRHNFTSKQMKLIALSLKKYTGAYVNKHSKSSNMMPLIFGIMTSPDYKFKDFLALFKNDVAGNNDLFKEIINIDVTSNLSQVQIPYLILQGEDDLITDTKMISDFISKTNNDNLKFKSYKEVGHLPNDLAMKEIINELKLLTSNHK